MERENDPRDGRDVEGAGLLVEGSPGKGRGAFTFRSGG